MHIFFLMKFVLSDTYYHNMPLTEQHTCMCQLNERVVAEMTTTMKASNKYQWRYFKRLYFAADGV